MDLAAVGEDTFADIADDGGEFVGTYVGMCFVEDGVGCTEEMEEFHDTLHVTAFLGAGEEFSVRESTCSAFSEAVVGFGVEPFVAVEECDVFFAFADFFSPFIDDRFDAMLQERECCEESGRSGSDDDGGAGSVADILKDRRGVERDRGIFGDGFAVLVRKNS